MNEKVLIIKDSEGCSESLKTGLENENYDVIVFEDGEGVMKVIREYKPQLIILFALYNKLTEYYIIKEKREMLDEESIPLMIVTNTDRGSEIEGVFHFGAVNCILKGDFNAKEIVNNVNEYFMSHNTDKTMPKNNMENKTIKEIGEEVKNKGLRVLLVEDDEFLRDICKRKLEIEGFNVSVAVDGAQALKKVEEEDPQMILLDVILPGLDGFEILKAVKANPARAKTPVIMLTNLGQTSEVEKGLSLGADEYIVKAHFTIGEIIEKIKTVMKRKNIK
ncbi:MAG: response regulator [Candidatus Paceibacterota bacterium]|jgi:DNA-binding response OmpR family regulator